MCDAVEAYAQEYARKRIEEERESARKRIEEEREASKKGAIEGARKMMRAGLDRDFIRQVFPLLAAEDIAALAN